ncbi:xyloglucan endotransglucosylase/hydrolase protein 31-like [Setaria italica]|uniref:xyloglucan endotransglucosylase/hydrolase protein 31-like n=1 Tax=Setaria italica TaxID=4555 RepID=UPI00035120FF|nr:xyloglucan endotransglucosylase/hydrolase protein 31-like [Setaria italica]
MADDSSSGWAISSSPPRRTTAPEGVVGDSTGQSRARISPDRTIPTSVAPTSASAAIPTCGWERLETTPPWRKRHLFLVNDVPIRRYERKTEATFPDREMWAYGSIWDASDWVTDGGRYRADYRYQPFVSRFADLKIGGCAEDAPPHGRRPVPASPSGAALSPQQEAAMRWAQRNSMVYYYCLDSSRDHALYHEC